MAGKHSKQPQQRHRPRPRTVSMVDVTGTEHLLTADAAADGLQRGLYSALCGADVVPAALVAQQSRFCRLCAPIPVQRSRW